MSTDASGEGFEAWAALLHAEYDVFLRQSWAAMQAARKGHWIADTEEHVRQAGETFRRKALERLLQAQVEAEQKSFSPSGGCAVGGQGPASGHPSDRGGARGGHAARLAAAGRRAGRTRG